MTATAQETQYVAEPRTVLQLSPEALIERVRTGFPYAEFERVRAALDLASGELGRLLSIPPRTLSRRRHGGRLSPDESERLLRVERLFALAGEMLRSDAHAREWLKSPKRALGGKTPLEYAETEVGAREAEDLIGRIRHGVFA
jgi:putative toxin-antitoxin system antitoxin component (TIGR02293 family)